MNRTEGSTKQSTSELLEVVGGVSAFFTVVPALFTLSRLGLINNRLVLFVVWLVLALLIALTVWRFFRWGLLWRTAAVVSLLVAGSVAVVPTIHLITPGNEADDTALAGPDTAANPPNDTGPIASTESACVPAAPTKTVFAYEDGAGSTVVDGGEIDGYRIETAKQPNVAGSNLVYLDEQRRKVSLAQVTDGEPVKSRILEGRVNSPTVSAGSPTVVFVQEAQAGWQIATWDPTSDEVKTVYSSKVEILSAKVSPSGQMVVWQERTSDGQQILISDIQQIQPKVLFEGDVNDPAWAPDNTQLVFSGKKANGYAIYTISVDDADEQPIQRTVPDSATDRQPSWSPSCSKISFVRVTSEESDLWTVDLETGQETQNSLSGVQGHPSYGHLG